MQRTCTITRGGSTHDLTCDEQASLLDVVRGRLGVRSASRGCEDGACGACRVLLNGAVVNACRVRWAEVPEGATIESFEDLAEDPAAARAVAAFAHERPTRCSLCVGGLGVTAVSLSRQGHSRDAVAVEEVLQTATCMCTGRGSWRRALMR